MSLYLGDIPIANDGSHGINTPFFFGQSIYSENAPYNASWLASNGQYNSSTLYPDFWTQLTGVELNSSLNVGDTIEISGKNYVKRGLPVVLSTGTITDYDFVVNQNDQTFRLPLLNGEESLVGDRYNDLTLNTSGSKYTAPANGWFVLRKFSGTGPESMDMESDTGISSSTFVNGYSILNCMSVLMKRNERVTINYYTTGATELFRFIYAKGNGTLYYYVGDTVQDASLINAGAVLGQLSNKADIDLNNVNNTGNAAASNLNSKGIRTVVETYKNGARWYRVWSDGWIEQGGKTTNTGREQNITFLKPFSDTNYFVCKNMNCSYGSAVAAPSQYSCYNILTTGFTTNNIGASYSQGPSQWYACGY